MKPRQREQQKQSARMYLRKHDHRDVIFGDKYHNAVWAKTEDIEDELVWVKYPKNGLMYYRDAGSYTGGLGWMDADRQFSYGVSGLGGGSNRSMIFGLDCGITVFFSAGTSSGYLYITEDGITWHKIDLGASAWYLNQQYLYKFGNDGLCFVSKANGTQTTFQLYAMTFSKDEETEEWSFETHSWSFVEDNSFNYVYFVCDTEQGCIVSHFWYGYDSSGVNHAENVTYVHIDHAGVRTVKSEVLSTTAPLFSYSTFYSYCRHGNQCSVIAWTGYAPSRYSADRYYRLFIATTTDKAETWNIEMLEQYYSNSGDIGYSMNADMYCRSGKIYAIWASPYFLNNKAHILEVGASTNTEIALPKWIDLPVIQEGGACVTQNPSVGETIRIAVDPSETSDADINLASMLNNNNGGAMGTSYLNKRDHNILYQDGEMNKGDSGDDFYLTLGLNGGYRAFFDNPQLAESTRAFAWHSASIGSQAGYADEVIPYDYVLG